jgi:hypothetical protein
LPSISDDYACELKHSKYLQTLVFLFVSGLFELSYCFYSSYYYLACTTESDAFDLSTALLSDWFYWDSLDRLEAVAIT